MIKETWHQIPDHPGYEISNLARVRSYRDRQGHTKTLPRILAWHLDGYGYPRVKLGRKSQGPLHRYMALAFLGPCPSGMEVRHKDSNPMNNHVSNLCYGTRSENYADRHAVGTSNNGERHGNAKLDNEAVAFIRAEPRRRGIVKELAQRFNVSEVTISNVRCRRGWRHLP